MDTKVTRYIDKYTTTIHHKKAFTGVYLNCKSLTARKYKIGLINCLLNRIHRIWTTQSRGWDWLVKFILAKNNYTEHIINSTIEKYLNKKIIETTPPLTTTVPPNKHKHEKQYKRFIVLPYVNRKAEDFAFKLKHLVETNNSTVYFNVAFKTPNTIGNMFPFKDRTKEIEKQ